MWGGKQCAGVSPSAPVPKGRVLAKEIDGRLGVTGLVTNASDEVVQAGFGKNLVARCYQRSSDTWVLAEHIQRDRTENVITTSLHA